MRTPQDTTFGIIENKATQGIVKKLKENLIDGNLPYINRDMGLYAVIDINDPLLKEISPFYDPIPMDDNNWAIDLRIYNKIINFDETSVQLPDRENINLLVEAAAMTIQWSKNPRSISDLVGNFPLLVFSEWIGMLISNSFGLNAGDGIHVKVAALHWAWVQKNIHVNDSNYELTEQEIQTSINVICNLLLAERNAVKRIVMDLDYVKDINDFCLKLRGLDIYKLHKFESKNLYILISNSWFGLPSHQKYLYKAIEYPPFFYTLVKHALVAAMKGGHFKKTTLTSLVTSLKRNSTSNTFLHNYNRIYSELTE